MPKKGKAKNNALDKLYKKNQGDTWKKDFNPFKGKKKGKNGPSMG